MGATPTSRRRRLGWILLFLAAAASIVTIVAYEHFRRQRLAAWHEREAARYAIHGEQLYTALITARDAGEVVRAEDYARRYNSSNAAGMGHENMAREYRKPLWHAWIAP